MKSTGNVLEIDNLIKDTTIEANKYLSLTLKRNDKDPKDTLSSVLHYDNGFVTLGDKANDFKGCSNKFFVDYIELNNYLNHLNTNHFEALSRAKVISLLSIRVWIEYKLATLSAVPLEDTYFKKVDKFFKNNQNVLKGYPNLKRDLLVNKKVMLNVNKVKLFSSDNKEKQEYKEVAINATKSIFEKLEATDEAKAVKKEDLIEQINNKNAKEYINYLYSLRIIKKYKGKYYYCEEAESNIKIHYAYWKDAIAIAIAVVSIACILFSFGLISQSKKKVYNNDVSFSIDNTWNEYKSKYRR